MAFSSSRTIQQGIDTYSSLTAALPGNEPQQKLVPPQVKVSNKLKQASLGFDFAALQALAEELDKETTSNVTEGTIDTRNRILARWKTLVQGRDPSVSDNDLWNCDTILKHWMMYLVFVVTITKPARKDAEVIKAKTLDTAMHGFAWAIANYAWDPIKQQKCGMKLLAHDALFEKLSDQSTMLINKYQLDRHRDPREPFSIPELKLIIEESLRMSEKSSRDVAIQRITMMVHSMFSANRPSTLGPALVAYIDQNKYPMLRHVTVYSIEEMAFRVHIAMENFKLNNTTVEGKRRDYIYEPVKKWANVIFDPGMWYVLQLLSRGAFEGIKTLDDLRNWKGFLIPIKKEMLNEPLFLKVNQGAHGFAEPPQPMASRGISQSCQRMCINAGLPAESTYSFRRGAANEYEILISAEASKQMLVHQAMGSTHLYSRNTGNIDIVGTRLNEMPVPHGANQLHLVERHHLSGRAVQALNAVLPPKTSSFARNTQSAMPKLPAKEVADYIETLAEFQEAADSLDDAWDTYLGCFKPTLNSKGKPYPRELKVLNDFRKATKNRKLVSDEVIEEKLAVVKAAEATKQKIVKKEIKEAHRRHASVVNQERKTAILGTTEDAHAALKSLKEPSKVLMYAHDAVEEIEEEDSPIDEGILNTYNKLRNLVGAKPKPETDEDEGVAQPCETDEPMQDCPEDLAELPASAMRYALMKSVLEPLIQERAITNLFDAASSLWVCPMCKALQSTYEDVVVATSKVRTNLERHIRTQHTPWKDVLMVARVRLGEDVTFRCPTPTCGFTAESEKKLIGHCIGEIEDACANQQIYRELRDQHIAQSEEFRERKKEDDVGTILAKRRRVFKQVKETIQTEAAEAFEYLRKSPAWSLLKLEEHLDAIARQCAVAGVGIE